MNRLLRSLQELEKRHGLDGCPACKDVRYIGMPGLFVYLNIPHYSGGPGTHRTGTPEEFATFFNGCPTCGEDVRTVPMLLGGLRHREDGEIEHARPEVPNPWPIHEWPLVEHYKPSDAEYYEQINELWSA
jgi:hypothetical protein